MVTYHKAKPVPLAEVGLDERWLQERILEDPSILGLGDLDVIERERRQSVGGRLDFLLSDPDTSTMYEVEVMLGKLNETHIIRTIEYWDIERRRWPDRDHRAVIVAEEITNRFFNVIALFNRSAPIIAVQLNALAVEDKIVLNFVKVLDIFESPVAEEEVDVEPADRGYWERRSTPRSLAVLDLLLQILKESGREPRVAYIKSRITLSRDGRIFCWIRPMKQQPHCRLTLRVGADSQQALGVLKDAGVRVQPHRDPTRVKVFITADEVKKSRTVVSSVLEAAYEAAGGDSD